MGELYQLQASSPVTSRVHQTYSAITALTVHLTPKYFFRSNKSLHLFETHCTFLPLFNSNLDFLQAVKVTKSGHHLLHDRASKGYGSIPCLTSLLCMHVYKDLIRCKSVCDIKQGIGPCPLQASSVV